MATPWYTSDELIAAVKRKISFPISQVTFTEDDILEFANEEMAISQVPAVLSYHEEYFSFTTEHPLVNNRARYPIPDRAIGMKLRDVFYKDSNGNLLEMTRVSQDDRAYFDRNVGTGEAIHKFYLEGNDLVLVPAPSTGATGSLLFVYYLKPNQLVRDSRAAVITGFCEDITVDNSAVVAGDTVTINDQVFTAVASTPSANEFEIGANSIETATNLKNSILNNGVLSNVSNGTPFTAVVNLTYTDKSTTITTNNSSGFSFPSTQCVVFSSIPSGVFSSGSKIDFLKTGGGHRTYAIDVEIQSVSTETMEFLTTDIPDDLKVGDYVCLAHECIIPQIPSELHPGLAERTCARILSALGDSEGLNQVNSKIQEIQVREGNLIDNRVEGAPQKITARNSMLRYGKMGIRRRR